MGKIEFYPFYIKMLFTIHHWRMCAIDVLVQLLSFSWSVLKLSIFNGQKII